jgi:general secretion pathway protein D
MPIPSVSEKDTRPAGEYVTAVVAMKHASAAQLVPILRPLMPQHGHLAAATCANQIILTDTYSNVRRLEGMIRELDVGDSYMPSSNCGAKDSASQK